MFRLCVSFSLRTTPQRGKVDEAIGGLDVMVSKGLCVPSRDVFELVLEACIQGKKTEKVRWRRLR